MNVDEGGIATQHIVNQRGHVTDIYTAVIIHVTEQTAHGKVARVLNSAVEVGIGGINMVGVIFSALATHKAGAAPEHIPGPSNGISAPIVAHKDGDQIVAVIEHVTHAGYLSGIEIGEVKTGQTAAVAEHTGHISHLSSVEVAHIEVSQTDAIIEHAVHVYHVGSFETAHVNTCQVVAGSEHAIHGNDVLGVEIPQVKARQFTAAIEHSGHAGHFVCIKTAHVNAGQTGATKEHVTHVGHFGRVQVIHARDGLQIGHVVKPRIGSSGAGIFK